VGVDGKLDASEEVSGSVGSLSFDVDGSFGQESDEGGHLGQHGGGLLDGDGWVLVKRAAAGKTRLSDDVAQDASTLAVIGNLFQGLADVVVGAGTEHLVSDGDAGKSKTVLLQGQFDFDGASHVLGGLGFQASFDGSGEGDGARGNLQFLDVEGAATTRFPFEGLGGGEGAEKDGCHEHLHGSLGFFSFFFFLQVN